MAKIDSKSLNKMIENGRNIGNLCTDCIKKYLVDCAQFAVEFLHKEAIK